MRKWNYTHNYRGYFWKVLMVVEGHHTHSSFNIIFLSMVMIMNSVDHMLTLYCIKGWTINHPLTYFSYDEDVLGVGNHLNHEISILRLYLLMCMIYLLPFAIFHLQYHPSQPPNAFASPQPGERR